MPAPAKIGPAKAIATAERSELVELFARYDKMGKEWVKRQVLVNNRIDILATFVLGYETQPFHVAMMKHQFLHQESLILAFRGSGKCLQKGTLVLDSKGSHVKVEDLSIGDELMGPDSLPRKVLETHSGVGRLYRVKPVKGEPFVCNENHILTLKGRGNFYGGKIEDFPIKEIIAKGKTNSRGTRDIPWKLFRVPVEFVEQKTPIHPYLLGLWLGDGTTAEAQITNPDSEVIEWIEGWAETHGYGIHKLSQRGCWRMTFTKGGSGKKENLLRTYLKKLGSEGKHIPDEYLKNSRKKRFQLLAGLIDTDGYLDPKGCVQIIQKSKVLAEQIVYLARSLGLAAYVSELTKKIKSTGFEGQYHSVSISGDTNLIPCRVKRKQASPRKIDKDPLVVGYDIEEAGVGEYFGFTLNGDGRHLLGDFTVTHNSTTCDITKIIHMLLVNPNLRILIASKVIGQAETFLKEIKSHFESNTKLEEIFGVYYDPRKVTKWDAREIEVLPRTSLSKEGSITCVGVGGMVVGRHYDVIISDDLVDEANSATQLQRDKVKSWFYSTLMPTLDPPDPKVPFRGQHHMLGTRYHYADLYGHLTQAGGEMEKSCLRVPALNEEGQSPWPSRWSAERFVELRRRAGLIIFNAQYQVDTEAMKGEIFAYDDCLRVEDSEIPKELRIYMGIDLAISEKDTADKFAIVVLGVDKDRKYYVLYFFEGQLRFSAQTAKIKEVYKMYDPTRCFIETNAYQEAQYQELKTSDPDIRLFPFEQEKDKISRAWKLSPLFENKRVNFKKNQHALIEHMVLFPNHRYKDLFDAFDLAVQASKKKRKRRRRGTEPGLI